MHVAIGGGFEPVTDQDRRTASQGLAAAVGMHDARFADQQADLADRGLAGLGHRWHHHHHHRQGQPGQRQNPSHGRSHPPGWGGREESARGHVKLQRRALRRKPARHAVCARIDLAPKQPAALCCASQALALCG